MVHDFVVEYSDNLACACQIKGRDSNTTTYLCSRAALTESCIGSNMLTGLWLFRFPFIVLVQLFFLHQKQDPYQEHINCDLLPLILKVINISPRNTLGRIAQNPR